MLTPKTARDKRKLRTIHYDNGNKAQGAFNVTVTGSSDPDCVLSELKTTLAKIGVELEQKGYCLIGKWTTKNGSKIKFELEVVAVDPLDSIGIRRKRHNGDAWAYKMIIEQVLSLTGVCQLPKNTPRVQPLQTTV